MSPRRRQWLEVVTRALVMLHALALKGPTLADSGASGWSYSGPHGEDEWGSSYPHCGSVHQQSPIDFHNGIFAYDPSLKPMQLMGYNLSETERLTLTNDGHALKLSLLPTMHITSLPDRYTAVQLHMHWGSKAEPNGSEHTISGQHYPSELHIVHYNSDKYESVTEAQDKPDGLAVLGILIEVGNFNPAYEIVFSHLKEIQYKDQKIYMPGFNVEDLLPDRLDQYFRYNGSLTTPPCYPSVLWTVFRKSVQISNEQLNELESDLFVSDKEETNQTGMVKNFRHVQKLGKREVLVSFHEDSTQKLSLGVVLAVILCCVFGALAILALGCFLLRKRTKKATENQGVIYKPAGDKDDDLS
ncbi:carbonic anhydrase 12 isoform X1 [Callorhinchus milii]|nr:carbonic anhydrase 12 isoform X1 [Callorhinchus milii]|eukprot:gi/632938684/ref/XP_007905957.1/ PREDICTED: carbonic anhydrase 12 isoform X1 [Callorhinchus milii]